MRAATVIGVPLIALGLGALLYQGFTYTTRQKLVTLGPLEATRETQSTIPLPPVVGHPRPSQRSGSRHDWSAEERRWRRTPTHTKEAICENA